MNDQTPPDAHELHEIDRLLRSLPRVEPSAAAMARTRKAIAAARGSRPRFFASIGLVAAGAAALVTLTMSGPTGPDHESATRDGIGLVGPVAVYRAEPAARGGEFSLFGGLENARGAPSQLEARVDGIPADGSLPLELRSVRHTPKSGEPRVTSAADLLRAAAAEPAHARDKLLTSLANDVWSAGDRVLLEGFAEALRDPTKAADVAWTMRLAAALRAER